MQHANCAQRVKRAQSFLRAQCVLHAQRILRVHICALALHLEIENNTGHVCCSDPV